jgi:hypothetical protein
MSWNEIVDFVDDDSFNGGKMAYNYELDKKE